MGWPAVTLPSGLNSERLPLGLQLIGAPFAESSLFAVARWASSQLDPMPAPDDSIVALAAAHAG
jgi:aspartyl-tRNA(Asn)/glutamyl-tRNA(Gln) amidotransferase subunit A